MRIARKKMIGRGCYYHCCARVAGLKDVYPFSDVDKAKGADVASYRFSTWGWYSSSGKDFFGGNFVKHMKKSLGYRAKGWSADMVFAEFRGELARVIAYESGLSSSEILDAKKNAKRQDSMPVKFLLRTRHWSDGAIIGGKSFIQEVGCLFYDSERVMGKRFSSGRMMNAESLHCFKRLRI